MDEAGAVSLGRADWRGWRWPGVAGLGVVVATLVWLRVAGRVWWCSCGEPTPFSTEVASRHNSQHLLDAYAFSHLLHGILFFAALAWAPPRVPLAWRFVIAMAVEAAWEIVENSPIVIERYRSATAALGYEGDSIVNSTGDLLACAVGFGLARSVGPWGSVVVLVVVELVMLWAIRDNLTLNVVMLFWPIEAVRQWQMGG